MLSLCYCPRRPTTSEQNSPPRLLIISLTFIIRIFSVFSILSKTCHLWVGLKFISAQPSPTSRSHIMGSRCGSKPCVSSQILSIYSNNKPKIYPWTTYIFLYFHSDPILPRSLNLPTFKVFVSAPSLPLPSAGS